MKKNLEQKLSESKNASEAISVMLKHFIGDKIPMTQLFLSKIKNEFDKIKNGERSLWEKKSSDSVKLKNGSVFLYDDNNDDFDPTSGYSVMIGSGAGEGAVFRDYAGQSALNPRAVNTILGVNAGKESERLYFSVLIGAGAGRGTKADLNPPAGNEEGIITAVGPSAARGIQKVNLSAFFGGSAGAYNKNIFRSLMLGYNTASQTSNNTKNVEIYKSTLMGSFNAFNTNNLDHVISIGHESLLGNQERKDSIVVGDYAGINRALNDSIFIGHYRKRGSGHAFGNPKTSNVISIGHFVRPEQEFTINFPLTYDMGLGTFTPDAKIAVKANLGQDSIAKFKDENDEVILDVKNNGSVSIKVPDNYADDAAAEAGGVPIGGVYRTDSALKVRVS